MVKKFVIVLLISFLVGCSTKIITIKVPVPVSPPKPELPARPVLSTATNDYQPNDVFVRNLSEDLMKLITYATQLENVISVYSIDVESAHIDAFNKNLTHEIK